MDLGITVWVTGKAGSSGGEVTRAGTIAGTAQHICELFLGLQREGVKKKLNKSLSNTRILLYFCLDS